MDFEPRPDNWTWIDIPRSVVPHFRPRNETHKLPPEKDEEILKRLSELKVKNMVFSLLKSVNCIVMNIIILLGKQYRSQFVV